VINQCVRNPFGLTSDATGGRSRLVDMMAVHMYSASEVGVQNCFGMFLYLSFFGYVLVYGVYEMQRCEWRN